MFAVVASQTSVFQIILMIVVVGTLIDRLHQGSTKNLITDSKEDT